MRRAGSFSEQLNLLYRDYLRADPEHARAYAEFKRSVAQTDRQVCVDAKATFVWATIARAHEWAQLTGWEPGPPMPGVPSKSMPIREATRDDRPAIWPFFREIVAACQTFAYDAEMDERRARELQIAL